MDAANFVRYISAMAEHDHDHNEGSNLSEVELRVRALETILVDKGYIESAALDRIVALYETKIGPHIGAQVIAKAWSDPETEIRVWDSTAETRYVVVPMRPAGTEEKAQGSGLDTLPNRLVRT
ncbi:MAG: nitrile hydratase subunit alpha [Candidatus Binatota bacterium]|nr:nitrile hydratase subunit alpha [Candidatus Binatota bacterium]